MDIPRVEEPASIAEVLARLLENDPEFEIFHRLKFGDLGVDVESSLTVEQLYQRSLELSNVLRRHAKQGDRVAILLPTGLEYPISLMACFFAGLIAVPLYPPRRNRRDERICNIVMDCAPKVVLGSAEVHDQVRKRNDYLLNYDWIDPAQLQSVSTEMGQANEVKPDQIAVLQYTSGSTGSPKGIMLTHRNIIGNSEVIRQGLGFSEHARKLTWLPFFHDMGLVGDVFQPIYSKFPNYLMSPTEFSQSPFRWLEGISKFKITHSGSPNFGYSTCLQLADERCKELDLSSWICAYVGAEIVSAKRLEEFAQKFAQVGFASESLHPCYGMAEATLMLTGKRPETGWKKRSLASVRGCSGVSNIHLNIQSESVSCGQTWNNHDVKIVDPENRLVLEDDTVGEIWCRGVSIGRGYWENPEATAKVFDQPLVGITGYFRTGDLGLLSHGELYILGRLKDLIILQGENHYPDDLEQASSTACPGLAPAAAAFGWVDRESQERLVVLQEVTRSALKELNTSEALRKIRFALLNQFVIEAEIIVLVRPASLPRTTSGKIQRFRCRQHFLEDGLAEIARWRRTSFTINTDRTGK